MVNVRIVQPSLPAYRIPFFETLSSASDLTITISHGELVDVPNAASANLQTSAYVPRVVRVFGRTLQWISAQFPPRNMSRGDVLVLEWNLNNISLLPAILVARLRGIGTILWGHGYSRSESRTRKRLRFIVGRKANAVLMYDEVSAIAARSAGFPPEQVFVAANTLDIRPMLAATQPWISDSRRLDGFRQEHGLDSGPVILHVSRLIPERHLHVLIQAMSLIVGTEPRARLVIVGDGDEKARLQRLVESLDIQHATLFVDGEYDEEELAPWFLSADVFCTPAHLGLSIFHAFAYGLPVVTGDAIDEHPPEVRALIDGANGLFFEHDNTASLASVLTSLLTDAPLQANLGDQAFQDVTTGYGMNAMTQGMRDAVSYAAHGR